MEIIRQAALALQCVHEQGIVHRDIKPSNIMLEVEGCVKVTDFGLAKLLETTVEDIRETTQPGILGGPRELAPEQAHDLAQAGAAADLYNLACTLFFLLTGGAPFWQRLGVRNAQWSSTGSAAGTAEFSTRYLQKAGCSVKATNREGFASGNSALFT